MPPEFRSTLLRLTEAFIFKHISIKWTKSGTPYLAVSSHATILFQMKYDNTIACGNYSNWLQRVQDDHVISCFMGERSPPSPCFHASVVFKGILYRTTIQFYLNSKYSSQCWLVNLKTKSNCRKEKMNCPSSTRKCHVGSLAEPAQDERGCSWQRDNSS